MLRHPDKDRADPKQSGAKPAKPPHCYVNVKGFFEVPGNCFRDLGTFAFVVRFSFR
jgi:hypothetical protein